MEFYRHNKSMHGVNTLIITSKEAAAELTKMKPAFESGELSPPAMLEETDLTDEKAVIAAYEKVKGGAKAKQILINKNLWGFAIRSVRHWTLCSGCLLYDFI